MSALPYSTATSGDGMFAVIATLALCIFCLLAGSFATWAWVQGTNECSAKVRFESVTVEYVTECRL
jgi:hypothetical protein